jgi:hypothetical protein
MSRTRDGSARRTIPSRQSSSGRSGILREDASSGIQTGRCVALCACLHASRAALGDIALGRLRRRRAARHVRLMHRPSVLRICCRRPPIRCGLAPPCSRGRTDLDGDPGRADASDSQPPDLTPGPEVRAISRDSRFSADSPTGASMAAPEPRSAHGPGVRPLGAVAHRTADSIGRRVQSLRRTSRSHLHGVSCRPTLLPSTSSGLAPALVLPVARLCTQPIALCASQEPARTFIDV